MSNSALVQQVKQGAQEVTATAIPVLSEGEVLVRIDSAGLNPVDWKIVKYGIFLQSWPTVLGSDGSGVVTEVAPGVTSHKVGDRVFFQARIGDIKTSTFQQYAAIRSNLAARLPGNISFEQGATLGVAGITAALGLFKVLKFAAPFTPGALEANKGKLVLIWGGSTSVGHVATQLANLAGLTVIVTASPQYHDKLKTLGATYTIDYRAADVVQQIAAVTQGKLFAAFDTTGPGSQASFDSLSATEPSILAVINEAKVTNQDAFANRSIQSFLGSSYVDIDFAAHFWLWVSTVLEAGKLVPLETKVIGGLDAIVAAQADQIAGKVSSVKLIAKP
ncbi:chaperonin 10-like protein [Chytriomyces sp. MP71]|nr:chaperonin 10-like protein [Chytriomyces sp. MP71]